MDAVRIPRTFYDDHQWRDLPTPPPMRETKRHVWIDPEHPDTPELVSDASYYADPYGPETPGLRRAARATLDALPLFVKCDRCHAYRMAHVAEDDALVCEACL